MPLTLATEKTGESKILAKIGSHPTGDSDADDSSNGIDDSSSELSWSDSNWTHVKFSIFEIFDNSELEISAKYYFETYQT